MLALACGPAAASVQDEEAPAPPATGGEDPPAGSASTPPAPVVPGGETKPSVPVPSATQCDGDPFAAAALKGDVGYLASKELGGRVPGTPGDVAARALIAARFKCLGLEPGGDGGSYEQAFVNEGGVRTANVVGIIRGSDPTVAAEIVLVGAHHDHFGTGGGQGLRLGANDNASGVAGMLAVAQAIAKRKTAPRRTMAFVGFGSEETAAASPYTEGSAHFVKSATSLPVDKVVYVVNFDMIGTYTQTKRVYALGSLTKTPANAMLKALTRPAITVSLGEPADQGASDFYPFCVKGVPYVFFWTDDPACYHKSCDTADRIDYEQMGEIAHVGSDLGGTLADTTQDLAAFRKTAKTADLGCTDE